MAQTKRKKGKSKEQNSNLPVPFFDTLIKPEGENNTPDSNKQDDQERIQVLPISKQIVVVKESKYERGNFWLQLALVICSIGMLVTVYILSSTQNKITNATLNFQIRKTFSDSIIQGIKDSLTLANADSSLALTKRSISISESSNTFTKQSLKLSQRGIEVAENNAKLSEEYNRIRLQPYPFIRADCHERDNIIYINIKNFGQTPMKDVTGRISLTHYSRPKGRDYYIWFEMPGIVLGYNECFIDSFVVPRGYEIPRDQRDPLGTIIIEYSIYYVDIWDVKHTKSDKINFHVHNFRM